MAEGRTNWEDVPDGWFVEPEAATEFLLARELFGEEIWDPSCGQGNILRTCMRHGKRVFGTDIVDRRLGEEFPWAKADFIADRPLAHTPCDIIMNPPYGRAILAEAFIRRAVALENVGKVAAFVNSKFLFSDGRAEWFYQECPPSRVYPVRPRPSCPPGEKLRSGEVQARGGIENFCWLVFDRAARPGVAEFRWT